MVPSSVSLKPLVNPFLKKSEAEQMRFLWTENFFRLGPTKIATKSSPSFLDIGVSLYDWEMERIIRTYSARN